MKEAPKTEHPEHDEYPDEQDITYLQWQNVSNSVRFLYQPHRLIFLILLIIAIFTIDFKSNVSKLIFFWIIATLMLANSIQDSPLVRPHPYFWRVILSFTYIMIFTMIAMSMTPRQTQLDILQLFTPATVRVNQTDRDYSMSCEIYDKSSPDPFHNVKAILFDEFVIAHFFGWFLQTVTLRDKTMMWVLSIAFEFVERSLKHWFPNFNECWWDSFILDVLLTNGLGIYLGMKVVDRFAIYSWEKRLISDFETAPEKLKRMIKQFTPRSYTRYEWKPLESPKRYLGYLLISFILLLMEAVLFALKKVWEMSTGNHFLHMLTVLDFFIALPGSYEFYLYITDVTKTIGHYSTAAILLPVVELLVVFRDREDFFSAPAPKLVKYGVSFVVATLIIFPLLWFPLKWRVQKNKKK